MACVNFNPICSTTLCVWDDVAGVSGLLHDYSAVVDIVSSMLFCPVS